MSYRAGVMQRLHKLWFIIRNGYVAYRLKIAVIILILIPCLSSITKPSIEEKQENIQNLSEIKYLESLSDVNALQNTDTSADIILPVTIPNLTETPEPIPSQENPEETLDAPEFTVYEVISGDTLGGIALRYGTSVSYLLQINEIDDPGSLSIGQLITVPIPEGGIPAPSPEPVQDPTIATAEDIETLALMIHGEAHWESSSGKLAVGQCAYDRWKNTRRAPGQPYVWNPDGEMTLSEIITWEGQFAIAEMTAICETCLAAARDVVSGTRAFRDYIVTNFRVNDSVANWNSLPYIGHIGGHAFYGYER